MCKDIHRLRGIADGPVVVICKGSYSSTEPGVSLPYLGSIPPPIYTVTS